jgi:hypothetical protein
MYVCVCMYLDSDSDLDYFQENWFDGLAWHDEESTGKSLHVLPRLM